MVLYCDKARKAAPKQGTCPLCGEYKPLVLDHCHEHWLVRGSVCHSCNTKIGYAERGHYTAQYYRQAYRDWLRRCEKCFVSSCAG